MQDVHRNTAALYEPLIERDLDAIPAAVQTFLQSHDSESLWLAVTRFAVLAYAPSQHSKRTVMACRAVDDLRDASGEPRIDLVAECARYAATSRQPWSEPPILDPPETDPAQQHDASELLAAVAGQDRLRAERWLAARIDDAEDALRPLVRGDALLVLDTVEALLPRLGEKGRFAVLRMPLLEMLAVPDDEDVEALSLDRLIARVIEERGSVDSVRAVFLYDASHSDEGESLSMSVDIPLEPYDLARDYAQTLIARAVAGRLPANADVAGFLRAVHENLASGESYADWSLA